jgi:hypothetical protein
VRTLTPFAAVAALSLVAFGMNAGKADAQVFFGPVYQPAYPPVQYQYNYATVATPFGYQYGYNYWATPTYPSFSLNYAVPPYVISSQSYWNSYAPAVRSYSGYYGLGRRWR